MNDTEREKLRKMLQPVADTFATSLREALVLRIEVMQRTALDCGAEDEDLPQITLQAIQTADTQMRKFLDEIGLVDLAKEIAKKEKENGTG